MNKTFGLIFWSVPMWVCAFLQQTGHLMRGLSTKPSKHDHKAYEVKARASDMKQPDSEKTENMPGER